MAGASAVWTAPEYTLSDLLRNLRDPYFVLRRMWNELHRSNLRDVKSVAVPVFLLEGEQDWIAPPAVAREFFEQLQAPRKEWVVFKDAGHVVPADAPGAFGQAIRQLAAQESGGARPPTAQMLSLAGVLEHQQGKK